MGEGLRQYYDYFLQDDKLALFARVIASREAIGGTTGHTPADGELNGSPPTQGPREEA